MQLVRGRASIRGCEPAPVREEDVGVLRFDFHWTTEGWRISEANTDVPGGFNEASGFARLLAPSFPGSEPAGDALVRAVYSGISRGSVTLVFLGRVPPGEYRRMRAPFQAGDWPGPVKYGYASVGYVEKGVTARRLTL